jgi:hypothetical protein
MAAPRRPAFRPGTDLAAAVGNAAAMERSIRPSIERPEAASGTDVPPAPLSRPHIAPSVAGIAAPLGSPSHSSTAASAAAGIAPRRRPSDHWGIALEAGTGTAAPPEPSTRRGKCAAAAADIARATGPSNCPSSALASTDKVLAIAPPIRPSTRRAGAGIAGRRSPSCRSSTAPARARPGIAGPPLPTFHPRTGPAPAAAVAKAAGSAARWEPSIRPGTHAAGIAGSGKPSFRPGRA